jgi:hypothetical protein
MKCRRFVKSLMVAIAVAVASGCVNPAVAQDQRGVLFVGNSLTYVGNLPAVFDSIQIEGHERNESDMLVAPGATLTERSSDGSVAKALSIKKYRVVVLQERGGDFACGFGQEACADSMRALVQLASLIRASGAIPMLLGTYQENREAAAHVEAAESKAAQDAGVEYVPVASLLSELRTRHPDMNWFASDGMHPGPDLTLLEALLLSKHVYGTTPPVSSMSVKAPIFTTKGPPLEVRNASSAKNISGVRYGIDYDANHVAILVGSINR